MKSVLKRPSLWAFCAIVLAGMMGPALLPYPPQSVVGAPFARPVWWGRGLSRSFSALFSLTDGIARLNESHSGEHMARFENGTFSFDWATAPAEVFALEGVLTAQQGETVRVVWNTPEGAFTLAQLSGQSRFWLNLDARDMIFKQALGLPLISRATEALFPRPGRYSLSVDGAPGGELKLTLMGTSQGLLGTDQRGRDVFALLLSGIGTSLTVGICATVASTLLGLSLGLLAGYAGGMADSVIMRGVDILMAIPTLPILMTLAGVWGKGLWQLVLILSLFSWMGTARSVRALVLSVRESPWVEGLKVLGATRGYILRRHLVPETAPIVLANLALGVPGAILSEAGLAFLGLSEPRLISWGRMLHEAHSFGAFTEGAWWLILPPGLGIVAMCLIFMDLGRVLEERIDPRLGGESRVDN